MNNKRTIIYFICLIIATFTIKAQNGNHFTHTVSKGQTLYSIARMYEVTVDEIIALNPECAQKLAIGYKLKIAQKEKSADATAPSSDKRYHTIQSGETLYRLGQMYGITPQAICAANPGLSINNFRTGEVILIPAAAQAPAQPAAVPEQPKEEEKSAATTDIRTTHKVEKGETLYSLARRYGVTEEELLAEAEAATGTAGGGRDNQGTPVVFLDNAFRLARGQIADGIVHESGDNGELFLCR